MKKAQAGSSGRGRGRDRQRKSKRGRKWPVIWRSSKSPAWGRSFRASSGQSSCFIWPWAHIWPDSGPSPVCAHLLAKMDSSTSISGRWQDVVRSGAPPFSDPWGTFLWLCCSRGLFDLKKWEIGHLYVLAKEDAALSCSCYYLYLEVSVHRKQINNCSAWDPSVSCFTYLPPPEKVPLVINGHAWLRTVSSIKQLTTQRMNDKIIIQLYSHWVTATWWHCARRAQGWKVTSI